MEITVIHGQVHKGSTYHISSSLLKKLADEDTVVHEYFLPKDGPDFCVGCFNCIYQGENKCLGAVSVQEIVKSMCLSQAIIIDSPTYCFEMSGQLKTLFDHMGYMWMSHRPRREMFDKIGIAVTTASGAGTKNITKSIARQLFWWGVPKTYRLGINVSASSWKEVPEKIKRKIELKTGALASEVKGHIGKVKPGFKTKFLFNVMRKMHLSNTWNMLDKQHWSDNKWLESERPWR